MVDHFEAVKAFARHAWAESGRVATTAWIVDCEGVARLLSGIGENQRAQSVSGALAPHRPAGNDILLVVQDDEPEPHVLAFMQCADGSSRSHVARITDGVLGAWEPREAVAGVQS
jgi:hypothetical protein